MIEYVGSGIQFDNEYDKQNLDHTSVMEYVNNKLSPKNGF